MVITFCEHVPAPERLAADWTALEARAECSFFQSWRWLGAALADPRFGRRLVIEAREAGRPVGLAVFGARAGLHLAESGDRRLDRIFVEHNGFLLARGYEAVAAEMLARAARRRRVVLSGVPPGYAAMASALPTHLVAGRSRAAPRVDLAALRASGTSYLDALSANTRQQMRRSARGFARLGRLDIAAAASVGEAQAWLASLIALHAATWRQRGQEGAFADPGIGRFHARLIDAAFPRGEVELLRIGAGAHVLGYLYNFRHRGAVSNYQSGFDYGLVGDAKARPGLTCHHLAIERALERGEASYDFLAGESRYKLSLATGDTTLHWLELLPRGSPRGLARAVWRRARGHDRPEALPAAVTEPPGPRAS